MIKNIGKRWIISLLLCVVAIVVFVQSNSEKVQLCGTWTNSQTQTTNIIPGLRGYYGTFQIDQIMNFSIFGTFDASIHITGDEQAMNMIAAEDRDQTIKGKYKVENGRITLEANGNISQTQYRLVGDSFSGEDGAVFRRQSNNSIPLIMKLISGVLILIAIALFGKNKKSDAVSSEPAEVL